MSRNVFGDGKQEAHVLRIGRNVNLTVGHSRPDFRQPEQFGPRILLLPAKVRADLDVNDRAARGKGGRQAFRRIVGNLQRSFRLEFLNRKPLDLLIVARTNAVRASNMDDALSRAEAYRAAGADLLLLSPRNAGEARFIAGRLGGPLMYLASPGGMADIGLSPQEMAVSFSSTAHTPEGWGALQDELHGDIDLETLLDIERPTVEKGQQWVAGRDRRITSILSRSRLACGKRFISRLVS